MYDNIDKIIQIVTLRNKKKNIEMKNENNNDFKQEA